MMDTKLDGLASMLMKKKEQYILDRAMLEQQWLKNLRQYRGIYDPDIEQRIPKDKSRAYPRDTRNKVKAFVAKMMEMMFPAQENNWSLKVSPFPSLPEDVTNNVIQALQAERELQAQQQMEQTGQEVYPEPLTNDEIEAAIMQEAKIRRDRMESLIEDQLMDSHSDWVSRCKRVVRSGAIYGAGFVRAPVVIQQEERVWQLDEETGLYDAVTELQDRPTDEFVKVWDLYPDLSANTWPEQEGGFERMVFTRQTLIDLLDRPGIKKDVLRKYLKENREGNYVVRSYETELNSLNKEQITDQNKRERRYEIFRWYGDCRGKELGEAGVEGIDDVYDTYLADVWMIDNEIIYADLAPFGKRFSDVYHAYIYTEDEEAGLTGVGMPEELRDRQMSICATTRAMYDNIAATAGPIFEVAVDLLKTNSKNKNLSAFTVLEREGEGPDLQYPAVRQINVNSVIPMISEVIKGEREMFDMESNIPSWTMGNAQPLGEAFRTSSNMSQMAGGANMVTKDHVRAFDTFVHSVINAYLQWNMEFGTDEDAKGDYQVKPKGALSLVAKEVRGAALDQFMQTLTPEERALLKKRDTLIERLKSRDLPTDLVVSPDEAEEILASMAQAQAQAQQLEDSVTQGKAQKLAADAERSVVEAQKVAAMLDINSQEVAARIQKLLADASDKENQSQLAILDRILKGLEQQAGGDNVQGA